MLGQPTGFGPECGTRIAMPPIEDEGIAWFCMLCISGLRLTWILLYYVSGTAITVSVVLPLWRQQYCQCIVSGTAIILSVVLPLWC